MIIKDPLQVEQTAYELLGVDRTIATAEVHGAFARALAGRPREAKALNAARSLLQNPVERALLDALLYEPATAERLSPSPADPSALAPARRPETAAAWTAALRESFPDLGILHSLAVLWYWWAMQVSAEPAGGPPVETLWSKALAYWAALLQSEDFWRGTLGLDAEQTRQATTTMESRLREALYRLAEQARTAGDSENEKVYLWLRTLFDSELETARNMVAAPLPLLGAGTAGLGCGRILLEEIGRLEEAEAWVAHGLCRMPDDKHLERVRLGLSPCSEAARLVEARQWQQALDALARLSPADRESAEAREWEARALIGRGRQQANLGDAEEARKSWAAAMAACDDPEVRRQAEDAIVETTLQQAQALATTQPEQAIAALEAGLQLVPAAKPLRALLDQLQAEFGAKVSSRPLPQAGAKDWQDWVVEAGTARLERDFDRAVACLRNALAVAPHESQRPVREMLANALANRAVRTINSLGDEVERLKLGRAPGSAIARIREQVQKAREDVDEAVRLNPTDDYVRRQKEQVDELYALTHGGIRQADPEPTPEPTRASDGAPGGQGKNAIDFALALGGLLLAWFSPRFAAISPTSGLRLSQVLLYAGALACCLGMRRDLARPKSGCLISALAAAGICISAYRLYVQGSWLAVLALGLAAGWAFLVGAHDLSTAKRS